MSPEETFIGIKIHGVPLDSVIGGASYPGTGSEVGLNRLFEAGAGFASLKTTAFNPARGPQADPSIKEADHHRIVNLNDGSALNCETCYPHDFATYLAFFVEAIKMGKPLLISVGYEVPEIQKTIHGIKEVLREFGQACPPVFFELSLHHAKGDPSEAKARVKAAVKAAGDYPVFVKISYYDGDFLNIARMAVEECGAKGIVGINSLGPFDAGGTLADKEGWLSGRLIEGVSLEVCRQVSESVCDPNGIPYVAVGGVDFTNIAKYLRAGADAVQTCTYLMQQGITRGTKQLTQALRQALISSGKTPHDLKGLAYPGKGKINLGDTMDGLQAQVAELTAMAPQVHGMSAPFDLAAWSNRCMGTICSRCEDGCAEGALWVVEAPLKDGSGIMKAPIVNPDLCEQCGACVSVCPNGVYEWASR